MVLQPLSLQLCLVAISWLSARPHAGGATLGLLMTDVPDLVRVSVVAPIGNSLSHITLSVGSHFDGSRCSKLVYY